jgi:hypothetical protein
MDEPSLRKTISRMVRKLDLLESARTAIRRPELGFVPAQGWSMPLQNLSDRAAGHFVPQIGQGTLGRADCTVSLEQQPCFMREIWHGLGTVPLRVRANWGYAAARENAGKKHRATWRNRVKWFEVLAGAISWGFKSPSPHHRF